MTDQEPGKHPGKEWRIITPENIDERTFLHGELALSSMAMALGWRMSEVEKPRETVIPYETLPEISKEVFGKTSYGDFAVKYLDWMSIGATANIISNSTNYHVNFSHSRFHYYFPTHEERLKVKSYAPKSEIKQAALNVIDTMSFPFTHDFHPHPSYKRLRRDPSLGIVWNVADLVPGVLTRERLGRFLETPQEEGSPAPKDHAMHGTIGRAIDVLCLAAGVKTSVTLSDTELVGDAVPYNEFVEFAKRNGVSDAKIRTVTEKLQQAAVCQLLEGQLSNWGEVVLEGVPQFSYGQYPGFKTLIIDDIAPGTLGAVKGAYSRLSPELAEVLSVYE